MEIRNGCGCTIAVASTGMMTYHDYRYMANSVMTGVPRASAIGEPKERIRIEPVESPVPQKEPVSTPVEKPVEKEPVGA